MNTPDLERPPQAEPTARRIGVAATFTAEPLEDALAFWAAELDLPAAVEFAPYGQVFQQLLDPSSLLSRNRKGVNVVLVRPEDWLRALPDSGAGGGPEVREALERNASDLVDAARGMAARFGAPLIVALCPDSPAARADREVRGLLENAASRVVEGLAGEPGVSVIGPDDFGLYPVDDYHDPRRDRLGHIPYTSAFFAAMGTVLARRTHALLAPPHKVVVLDCDNTLWKGVVGEEGVDGIAIPTAWQALQRFMVELAGRGFLLCLCSKNVEADVLEVFDCRGDMILKREHLVTWRVNWQPKSQNIREMARELNLGLDSFIFIDDNPVECAEVEAACPEVLSLRLPVDGDIEGFLRHVWAFDRPRVTAEDRQRTAMYRQEAERARFQKEAPTIGEFLARLGLEIDLNTPSPEQVDRVAQLTQRTNQFNFTTVRRNDGEVRRLGESGLECRSVVVRDRFGDYGLVGVMIFGPRGEALAVDTFLLSCRVLGRGVEHRMMAELGRFAQSLGLARVDATVLFTRKNQPARDFLEGAFSAYRHEIDGGVRYEIPADVAARLAYHPEAAATVDDEPAVESAPAPTSPAGAGAVARSRRFGRIAAELADAEQVLEAIHARSGRRRARPESCPPADPPRTALETELAAIWADLLRIEPVGIRDNFFDMGGTSLLAVDLFARIDRRFGRDMPLTSLLEAPTVEALARLIAGETGADTLVKIRDGGDRPPLFLVHDGDGETMLYRNLALRLDTSHAVYGLQPYAMDGVPMAHTRITEMAAYHVAKVRSIQPHGPYLLGGMCAGGIIAFEMALQLQAQGERVALVALLDAADPQAVPRAWRVTGQRLQRFGGVLREGGTGGPVRRAATILARAMRKVRNLAVYAVGERLGRARDEVRMRLFRAWLDRGLRPPRALGRISVRTAYLFAERSYRPAGRFDGELTLFRATAGIGPDEPYAERYEDALLGWGCRATGGARALDVTGGHSSMLQEPHVEALAERLQFCIDAALADEPASRRQPALA